MINIWLVNGERVSDAWPVLGSLGKSVRLYRDDHVNEINSGGFLDCSTTSHLDRLAY